MYQLPTPVNSARRLVTLYGCEQEAEMLAVKCALTDDLALCIDPPEPSRDALSFFTRNQRG